MYEVGLKLKNSAKALSFKVDLDLKTMLLQVHEVEIGSSIS